MNIDTSSFFTEDEFRCIYNRDARKKLKENFDPRGAFLGLHQKAVLGKDGHWTRCEPSWPDQSLQNRRESGE